MKTLWIFGLLFLLASGNVSASILREPNRPNRYEDKILANYQNTDPQLGFDNFYQEVLPPALTDSVNEFMDGKHGIAGMGNLYKHGKPSHKNSIHELIQHSMLQNIEDLQTRQLLQPSNGSLKSAIKKANKIVKIPNGVYEGANVSRKLALKKKKKSVRKSSKKNSKKSQKNSRKLKSGVTGKASKFLKNWFVPERLGILSLLGGGAVKYLKDRSHKNSMKKLKKFERNQRELNLHTKHNELMLKKINEALKRSNHQVEYMKTIADERLANKIDQLRVF